MSKTVAWVLGILVILMVSVVGGGVWWFNANKDRLMAIGKEATASGSAYGKHHSPEQCITKALEGLTVTTGLMDETSHRIFLGACFELAAKKTTACDSVPAKGEIMATATWAIDVCDKHGRAGDQACSRVMQAVPPACESGRAGGAEKPAR